MKFFILSCLFLLSFLTLLGGAILVSPYYFYAQILKGNSYLGWYESKHFDKKWLIPEKIEALEVMEPANSNLWQNFHLKDVTLSLPVRNPFYQILPILDPKYDHLEVFGLSFYGTNKREISKAFFISNAQFLSQINSQGLFKLPLIKKELLSYDQDELWHKVFTKKITNWNISFKEMIENLYIIELRKNLLPENFKAFGLMEESNYALVKVESSNKDFDSEYIFTRNKGMIYSMILYTRKEDPDAFKLRYKLLSELRFRPTSKSLSSIIHKEFVALPYKLRVDQVGMLYLLSAWSQDPSMNYIKEMIEFLERGEGNELQLEALYSFALKKYGTTYTTRDSKFGAGEVKLRRSIELEDKDMQNALKEKVKNKINTPPTFSREEELKRMLIDAKKNKKSSENEILFD